MPARSNGRNTKHQQLTRTLLGVAQSLQPGDRFPSQPELMQRYRVSDRTLLHALDDLEREGWIVRRQGVGTFVSSAGAPPQKSPLQPAASKTIAGLALTFSSFYNYCIDLLSVQAEAAGLSLVCHRAQSETSYGDMLPLEALDPRGFVAFSYHLHPIARRLLDRGHRTVIVGAPPAGVVPRAPCVYANHEYGGWLAVRHLLDLGHRRIAFVFTSGRSPFHETLRWQGNIRAIEEARQSGHEVHPLLLEPQTLAQWRADPSQAADFFRRPGGPTAVVCWNDTEALLLLRALHDAGVHVPDEVSIVGYNALPEGAESLLPLTTVDQHVEVQLRATLDLLMRPFAPPPTQSIIVMPTLVSGATCAPPRQKEKLP